MKLLVVQPGASFSVSDVHDGLVAGFEQLGHTVIRYRLDARIAMSGAWLRYLWKRQQKEGGPLAGTQPTAADVQYHAGSGLLERALRFQPDWVVVITAMYLHPDVLLMLKRAGVRMALVGTESPYDTEQEAKIAPLFDVVWTNERTSVATLRNVNPNTYYLPVAYDPARLVPNAEADEWATQSDVCFVGTGFQERIELLEQIDWSGIDLALYGEWSGVRRRSPIKRFIRGSLTTPAQTMALYRKTKIGLNLYRQSKGFGKGAPRITHAESLNPRAYELAAMGVFQVSDYRMEVDEVFRGSVPTFSSPLHLECLLREALRAGTLNTTLAAKSQQRVQEHTYVKRAAQVCDLLEARLAMVTPATQVAVTV